MINYNGGLTDDAAIAIEENRGFLYGDAVFDTFKVLDGKILFLEDHYFRLMASVRIVRMEIPLHFTMEYLQEQVSILVSQLAPAPSYRVRITFFRKPGGKYMPATRETEFIIKAEPLQDALYSISEAEYEVELYKDFYISKQLISTLKTNNRILNVTASIFAHENGYASCLMINDDKNVIEAQHGNLFMLTGNKLITPPITDGCLNGIMRKQILELARKTEGIEVAEASISPFDLQKADELFITNVITGVQPITRYRKKEFTAIFSPEIVKRLNAKVRLG
ncbi:aminotransferase class IV [Flavobacterium sp. RHBU_3]|uniref:aminotransferase class IV n=1 Tax=Flavobacterium sp. RHBU_3 TaxID=3391184 RepID=UPI0039850E84